MAYLYLVRHAETLLNAQGRFNAGTVDSPLTEKGLAATRDLARLIRPMHFDRIIVSPLNRTVETARILVGEDEPLMTDERLKEVDVGDWNGCIEADYMDHPQYKNFDLLLSQFDAESIHAEPIDHLLQRGISGLTAAASVEHDNDRVLIVSHGYLLTVVANYLTGVPLDETRAKGEVKNSSVSVLEKSGDDWRKLNWNVTAESVSELSDEQQYLFTAEA